ncbi:MAG TPA: hypothetical protein EYP19_03820 [Desulfobacterales bacterium]|nr:hypothetical protein [Desulfobacterales bacterium]
MNEPSHLILERFPGERQQIIDLCTRNSAVSELCEDYETIINALIEAGADSGKRPESGETSLNDLFVLKQELEQELMDRLRRQQKIPKQVSNTNMTFSGKKY